ncbi:hypothetical protein POM88_008919 [Heracleum sosnowskyi]|uniref:Protein FAR1-RELATED SEQUENCE n=1 Tax=Heracleum sosnowskyi TaxID=360622 RepID=A0AAD8JAF0_9APIA|nr:hypothetical protein POM88_008919 [Heracleum sosnowskyi]
MIEDDFEARWETLLEKYDLQEHTWLQRLYELKEKWIIAYTRNTFSAGQNTTSRSEGMNSFFDSYVSSATGLKEFVENAQKALARQFVREKEEDYVTCTLKRPMKLYSALEYDGAKIYTKEMFRKFQDELVQASLYYVMKDIKSCEEGEKKGDLDTYYCCYRQELGSSSKLNYVAFNKEALTGMCMCRMVEHLGIPCRHILAVLNKKRIPQIPQSFIIRRWTMHANRVDGFLPYELKIGESHDMTSTDRFNSMTMLTMSFCHSSIASQERYDYAVEVMNREIPILERMSVDGVPSHESKENPHDESGDNYKEPILDPIVSQTKGRKKVIRFKSPTEVLGKKKAPRKCKKCNMQGHDKRNCPDLVGPKNSQYE